VIFSKKGKFCAMGKETIMNAIITVTLFLLCAATSFAADAARVEGDLKVNGIHFSDSSTMSTSKGLLKDKGAWSSSTLYSAGDVVQSLGGSYVCTTANINVMPPNGSSWSVLSAQGLKGDTGAQGNQGLKGDTGATGVIQGASVSGYVLNANEIGSSPLPANTTWNMISATVPVTITTVGQSVFVTSNVALGSTVVGGASNLDIAICYTIMDLLISGSSGGLFDMKVAQNTRQVFSLSYIITNLFPGTYSVGMCATTNGNANWNNNEYSFTSALVF
jgi:hypothetical protein